MSHFNGRGTITVKVLLTLLCSIIEFSESKLVLENKTCGELECSNHEYCSKMDHSCRPCQLACDPQLNNYDQNLCEAQCQGKPHVF